MRSSITLQINGYRWIEGVEQLLYKLRSRDVEMHIITNYPVWYKRIEAKLALSRFLPWSFVSCEGPMEVSLPYLLPLPQARRLFPGNT